ncbi:MAG: hypothetical protein QXY15_00840 [Candidatus Nitrosotenuis sp.]
MKQTNTMGTDMIITHMIQNKLNLKNEFPASEKTRRILTLADIV